MKEFEKWWKTQEGKWSLICCPAMAKKTWRAALEWIYKEAKELEKQPEVPVDAFDLIEEELKE